MQAFDQLQFLIFHAADRDHHPAAFRKLREKRSRGRGGRGGHQNGIERSEFRQAQCAVAAVDVDICVAQAGKALGGLGGQFRAVLDGEDFLGERRENRGLVAASRAYFQHSFVAAETQGGGHGCDDVRLRDGLTVADRQRRILVCTLAEIGGDKFVARHRAHGGEDTSFMDAPAAELRFDHGPAGGLMLGW